MKRSLKTVTEIVGVVLVVWVAWVIVQSWSTQSTSPDGLNIESLVTQVNQYCADKQISNKGTCISLLKKLQNAIEARDRNQPKTACNILNAFANEVQAQSGKKIDPAAAEVLINMVMPLCSPTPTVTPTEIAISPLPTPTPIKPQTIVFTVRGTNGPEIYRLPIDNIGQKIGLIEKIDFPIPSQAIFYRLIPSPNQQKIVIPWVVGEASTASISILDTQTKDISPLFVPQNNMDLRGSFLSWYPNNQEVLVMGTFDSSLRDSAWNINLETHTYHEVNIKQNYLVPIITSASVSTDGNEIVYSQSNCYQCPSQIWKLSTNIPDKKLLFENSANRVEDLAWSFNNSYISFVQWDEYHSLGQLYISKHDGTGLKLISSTLVDYYHNFMPMWSPNGQKIAFVSTENNKYNLYVTDIDGNKTSLITSFDNKSILRHSWSPDGSKIVFIASSENEIRAWVAEIDNDKLYQLGLNPGSITPDDTFPEPLTRLDNLSSLIWLP